jgi:glutamate-1-semialdehyde aminotransferase
MIATLRFTLPDEQSEYDAARLGSEAMQVLWQIDQTCRSLLKHGAPTAEERRLAEQIREMIPGEMLDI